VARTFMASQRRGGRRTLLHARCVWEVGRDVYLGRGIVARSRYFFRIMARYRSQALVGSPAAGGEGLPTPGGRALDFGHGIDCGNCGGSPPSLRADRASVRMPSGRIPRHRWAAYPRSRTAFLRSSPVQQDGAPPPTGGFSPQCPRWPCIISRATLRSAPPRKGRLAAKSACDGGWAMGRRDGQMPARLPRCYYYSNAVNAMNSKNPPREFPRVLGDEARQLSQRNRAYGMEFREPQFCPSPAAQWSPTTCRARRVKLRSAQMSVDLSPRIGRLGVGIVRLLSPRSGWPSPPATDPV